jgi:nucleoside 2-deoxyribosyltransferase
MRVYVAGSMYSPGIYLVRDVLITVRAAGHEVTYDWTEQPISETGDPDERRELAQAERRGVLDADLLILIDYQRPRGALIEMGMALGAGKEALVLMEEGSNPSLFYHLPNCTIIATYDNLHRAIELLPDDPRCIACDGKGYFEYDLMANLTCSRCDGSGAEPRKR